MQQNVIQLKKMSTRTFANTLTKTVDELTRPESYKDLYHEHKDGVPLPSGEVLQKIVDLARGIIFPGYYGRSCIDTNTLKYHLGVDTEQLYSLLVTQIQAGLSYSNTNENIIPSAEFVSPCLSHSEMEVRHQAELYAELFISKLPELRRVLATDVVAAFNGDPAAKNYGEIISCYPVIKELTVYRIAHELWNMNVPLIPRMLTEMGHSETGIDIHPGATIGDHFFIDHGTGIVIGETTVIGEHVKIYQGVTLGGLTTRGGQSLKGQKRHPTIEDNVTIYAGASVLGGETVIGRDSVIGSNAFITTSIDPCTTVSMKNVELQYKVRNCPGCARAKDHFCE